MLKSCGARAKTSPSSKSSSGSEASSHVSCKGESESGYRPESLDWNKALPHGPTPVRGALPPEWNVPSSRAAMPDTQTKIRMALIIEECFDRRSWLVRPSVPGTNKAVTAPFRKRIFLTQASPGLIEGGAGARFSTEGAIAASRRN